MIERKLAEEIWESYHENEALWSFSKARLEYNRCACTNIIKVFPQDAKSLDEVQSFEVTEDISGVERIICTRRGKS